MTLPVGLAKCEVEIRVEAARGLRRGIRLSRPDIDPVDPGLDETIAVVPELDDAREGDAVVGCDLGRELLGVLFGERSRVDLEVPVVLLARSALIVRRRPLALLGCQTREEHR